MNWEECLRQEAKEIIKHTDGELSLVARPIGVDKTKVIIKAGKSYSFIVDRKKVVD